MSVYQRLWAAFLPSLVPVVSAFLFLHFPFWRVGVNGFFSVALLLGGAGFVARFKVPESSNGLLLTASSLFLIGGTFPHTDALESLVGMGAGFALLWLALKVGAEVIRRVPHQPPLPYLRYVVGFQGAAAVFCLTVSLYYIPPEFFWCGIGLGTLITAILGVIALRMEEGWGWAPR